MIFDTRALLNRLRLMAWHEGVRDQTQHVIEYWRQRSSRERRFLVLGVLALVVLLFFYIVTSWYSSYRKLDRTLPTLRSDSVRAQTVLQSLPYTARRTGAETLRSEKLLSAVTFSLTQYSLTDLVNTPTLRNESQVEVTFKPIAIQSLTPWFTSLTRSTGVQVISVDWKMDETGKVQGSMVMGAP